MKCLSCGTDMECKITGHNLSWVCHNCGDGLATSQIAMRKNEFNSLEEFTSQYIGVWGPSDGHWFGLDFSYNGIEYRFNTGSMYEKQDTTLSNGKEALFGLYRKDSNPKAKRRYVLLEEFADMEDALNSTCIEGVTFREVIMDDNTEILGQD